MAKFDIVVEVLRRTDATRWIKQVASPSDPRYPCPV